MAADLTRLEALAGQVAERAQPAARRAAGRSWYRVENRADVAEVWVYDAIGEWGVTAQDFVTEVRGITAKRIDLHLNSPGGQVFDGVAIFNALVNHPAEVTAYVDGLAASAASFIAMSGDTIVIEKNARMMIHDAAGLCIGNARDMRELADLLDGLSDTIAEMYADRAGGTRQQWRDAMHAETWYTAAEAVAAGLADRIAGEDTPDAPGGPQDSAPAAHATTPETPAAEHDEPEDEFRIDPEQFRKMMEEAFSS